MDDWFGLPSAPVILPGLYTVATLPTPSSTYVDMYARVSDLYGEKRDLVLCSQGPSGYYWQPVRPVYCKSLAASGLTTLTPLQTPSVLFITGTLLASQTINLSQVNAFPGAMFQVKFTGLLGIFGITIAGLDAGATLSLLLNGARSMAYDGSTSTWKEF